MTSWSVVWTAGCDIMEYFVLTVDCDIMECCVLTGDCDIMECCVLTMTVISWSVVWTAGCASLEDWHVHCTTDNTRVSSSTSHHCAHFTHRTGRGLRSDRPCLSVALATGTFRSQL